MAATIYDLDENFIDLVRSEDTAPLRQRRKERLDARAASTADPPLSPSNAQVHDDYFHSRQGATVSSESVQGPNLFPAGATIVRDDPTRDVRQTRIANFAFLLLGIGVAIAWTAIRAGISFFSANFPAGQSTYNYLQICYNGPILPLLILQTIYDERFDNHFSSTTTYVFRFVVSMTVMTGCLLIVLAGSQTWVLLAAVLVGVFDSVAFGTAAQLFSLFPQASSGFYLLGASLSSVVSVVLTFSTGFDSAEASQTSLRIFYSVASLFCLVGLLAALYLVRSPLGRHYLRLKDDALRQAKNNEGPVEDWAEKAEKPLLTNDGTTAVDDAAAAAASPPPPIVSNMGLLKLTLLCHIALFVGWACTNLSDSLIAFVPSQKDTATSTNGTFKLILLYSSLGGELLGKQFNLIRKGKLINGPKRLLAAILVRAAFMIPMVLYVCQPLFEPAGGKSYRFLSDGLIVAAQVLFDASGSYLSSLTYSIAPSLLPHPALRAQSSTLLAITLMLGVFLGLGISLGLAHALSSTTIVY